jgi:hypothetical protein
MTAQQLTLDNDKFLLLGRKKIQWAKPPQSDPSKLTFYRVIVGDESPIYDLIEKVAPEISTMYPEMNGLVLGIRVKGMSWCGACWVYDADEIHFSSATVNNWTPLEVGATLAHELTHAFHSKFKSIPGGEKATDVFMLARVPLKYLQHPCYLEVTKEPFEMYPERIQELAKQAIVKRDSGLRQYIRWFEDEVNKIYYDWKGEQMPKRKRFSWVACKKQKSVLFSDPESKAIPISLQIESTILLRLMDLEKQSSDLVLIESLIGEAKQVSNIDRETSLEAIRLLLREGTVYEPREGYIKKT